ncbi:hypothetical protein VHEMI00045 [[Torrubiella] hemipterigena]|uniref:Zn(2)-C6 fungal-type domain-containing protein n=1 Tax=[Torrubiella] hemipterigena TaxID=1531966 RepID=A0A0A1SI61_9HYPO|nr:hypothetical protein VHEMI00045 [[Torrubiella] hemipterigena]
MSTPKSCWECVKKRRVCDAALPHCQKCTARGIACPGYDGKPLRWLNPGQTRSKGYRAKTEARALASAQQTTRVLARAAMALPPQLHYSGAALAEAVVYYNKMIAPDMVAIPWAAHDLYALEKAYIPYMPPVILESIICSSLAHKILQTSHNMPSDESLVLVKRLQQHRGTTIKLMTDELEGDWGSVTDVTLASMICFLLTEMHHCVSPIWKSHCDAIHAVLDARGGLRSQIADAVEMEPLFRYYVATEILGASTSPNVSLHKAEQLLDIVDLLPGLFGEAITTSIPCPAPLLQETILITHRRAVNSLTEPSKEEAFIALKTILNRIRSFSVESWIEDVEKAQNRIITEAGMEEEASSYRLPQGHQHWLQIGFVYQAAVAMYCLSSLCNTTYTDSTSVSSDPQEEQLSFIKESCRRSLLGNLKELASGSEEHPRKMVLWPLIMAGLVSETDADGSRSFVLSELVWLSRALGTASPLIACELLKRLWTTPNTKTQRCWDDLFDRPYCFTI